jgi:hypothetical protein
MGLTQLEAAKTERDPARLAVIRELTEDDLLRVVPFQNVEGEGVFYDKEEEYPSIQFRGLNEGYETSYGVLNPQSERLKIMGGDCDVDTAIIDMRGPDTVAQQVQMYVRSIRMNFADYFVNGDETTDIRSFDGLKRRIPASSSQANNMNGPLSLFALDEAISAADAMGGSKVLLMNERMKNRLTQASRNTNVGGYITATLDEFGREVLRYNGLPIVTVKTNAKNQAIMPFGEDGGSTTSIYCVAFGDLLTTGLQGRARGQFGISVRAMGEVQDNPVDRTRIEWYCGMAIYNGRSVSRLYGITDAAAVA